MGIFQEPGPDLDHINDQEEAPDIPNRVLYYLAVVMSDPQMSRLIQTMHVLIDMCVDYSKCISHILKS